MIQELNKDVIGNCISYLNLYDNLIFSTCCKDITLNYSIDRKYIYRKISAGKLIKYLSFNDDNPLTDTLNDLKEYITLSPPVTNSIEDIKFHTIECMTYIYDCLFIKNNMHYYTNSIYIRNTNYHKTKKFVKSNELNSTQYVLHDVFVHKTYRYRPIGKVKNIINKSLQLKSLIY